MADKIYISALKGIKSRRKHGQMAHNKPRHSEAEAVKQKKKDKKIMKIGVVMGSASDWGVMSGATAILEEFGVEYEKRVLSAHRTPVELEEWVSSARDRGFAAIIAGAGGAAHLAGVVAAFTTLPVIGVPVKAKSLEGLDSLLSMVQMPSGIPVATVGIDGAKNAALLAVAIMSVTDPELKERLDKFRENQAKKVLESQNLI